MTDIRYGAILPAGSGWEDAQDLARQAERVGFGSIWVPDGLAEGQLEAMSALAGLAAKTEGIELGIYMLNASLRDPIVLARSVAVLECSAPGRIRIILGTGWDQRDYEALGRAFPSPDARMRRTAEALMTLKRETGVPVGVAGVRDQQLRLAAEEADGWALSADALDTYFERVAALRRVCAEIGRDADEIRVSCTLPAGSVDRIHDLAAHGVDEFLTRVGTDAEALDRPLRSVRPRP